MTSTPISDMALAEDLPEFQRILDARLDQGRRQYGDGSFSKDPLELVKEMQQETLDIAGWGFILWRRLKEMERTITK
jgi:hypothetical protein